MFPRFAFLMFAIWTAMAAATGQVPSEADGWLVSPHDIRLGLERACMLPEVDLYPLRHAVDIVLVSDGKLSGIATQCGSEEFTLLTALANDPITLGIAEVRALRLRNALTPEETRLSRTQVVRRTFPKIASHGVTVITADANKYRGTVLKVGLLTVSLELEKTGEHVSLSYDQIQKASYNRTIGEKTTDSIPIPASK